MDIQPHFLLRIYTDEAAIADDRLVFELILERAHAAQLLGATMHRARAGFGHSTQVHRRGFLDHNYPVVIEIIDVEGRVRPFWDSISTMPGIGLVTLERVEALHGGRSDAV